MRASLLGCGAHQRQTKCLHPTCTMSRVVTTSRGLVTAAAKPPDTAPMHMVSDDSGDRWYLSLNARFSWGAKAHGIEWGAVMSGGTTVGSYSGDKQAPAPFRVMQHPTFSYATNCVAENAQS